MAEEDLKWVAHTRNGDRNAFGKLVRKYQSQVYGLAFHMVGNFADAEDLTQEAFVQAYRNLDRFGEPNNFPGWLRTIAVNLCRMHLRRGREVVSDPWSASGAGASGDPGIDVIDDRPTPEEAYERQELSDRVMDAVHALSERNRLVVTLYYIDGLSCQDIGDFLEIPTSTVKVRLHRARKQLREEMIPMVAEDLRQHGLPETFPERIQRLIDRPHPLEVEGHPLRRVWDQVRAYLSDYTLVDGSEIMSVEDHFEVLGIPPDHSTRSENATFYLDDRRVLRTHTTPSLAGELRRRKPPVKLLTAGRCFRPDEEDATHSQVFHQIEVLWVEKGLGPEDAKALVTGLLSELLGDVEVGFEPEDFSFTDPGWEAFVKRDGTQGVGGLGMMTGAVLEPLGIDADRFGCIGAGLGLERLAMLMFGIEDIREFR